LRKSFVKDLFRRSNYAAALDEDFVKNFSRASPRRKIKFQLRRKRRCVTGLVCTSALTAWHSRAQFLSAFDSLRALDTFND